MVPLLGDSSVFIHFFKAALGIHVLICSGHFVLLGVARFSTRNFCYCFLAFGSFNRPCIFCWQFSHISHEDPSVNRGPITLRSRLMIWFKRRSRKSKIWYILLSNLLNIGWHHCTHCDVQCLKSFACCCWGVAAIGSRGMFREWNMLAILWLEF